MNTRSFASDNNAGVHPDILKAIEAANNGHVVAYGDDPYTEKAIAEFKNILGSDIEVFFVFGGTAANVLGIKTVTEPFNAVMCAETAHINVDECGAPEKFTGCKLLTILTTNGKITVEQITRHFHGIGDQHHVQPKVISITQATEMGTLYTPKDIKTIADYAHQNDMFVHIDGARIANAVVGLDVDIKEITQVKITQEVQANAVFAIVPKHSIPKLQEKYFFYVWNEETSEVRWMASFDTQKEDIENFVKFVKEMVV